MVHTNSKWYLNLALASSAAVKKRLCHTSTPHICPHSVDLDSFTFYLGSGHDVFLTLLFECVIRCHSSNRSTVYSVISGYLSDTGCAGGTVQT
jgi:hypothetical protein